MLRIDMGQVIYFPKTENNTKKNIKVETKPFRFPTGLAVRVESPIRRALIVQRYEIGVQCNSIREFVFATEFRLTIYGRKNTIATHPMASARHILKLIIVLLILTGCGAVTLTHTPVPLLLPTTSPTTATSSSANGVQTPNPEWDTLITSVAQQLVGTTDRYISQIDFHNQELSTPLKGNSIRRCWVAKGQVLSGCDSKTLTEAFQNEQGTHWRYAYVTFAVVAVDSTYNEASIRYDESVGPMAGTGYLMKLSKKNGQWRVDTRQVVWVS